MPTLQATEITAVRGTMDRVVAEVSQSIELPMSQLVIALGLLATGESLLLDSPPGQAKTELAKALAAATGGTFGRSQGTPDLTPGDVTGYEVYNQETGKLEFVEGPIFSNFYLFDDMSRASTKSQSAYFEAAAERQVTVGNVTRQLPNPSGRVATVNPEAEGEGISPIPAAGRDRFLGSLGFRPYSAQDMVDIEAKRSKRHQTVKVAELAELIQVKQAVDSLSVDTSAVRSGANIVVGVREHEDFDKSSSLLAGQRALISILHIAKILALFGDKNPTQIVTNAHIKEAAYSALPHRMDLEGFEDINEIPVHKKQVIDKVVAGRGVLVQENDK